MLRVCGDLLNNKFKMNGLRGKCFCEFIIMNKELIVIILIIEIEIR